MSANTQKQGRSFYTERDFAFTPSATATGDMYRTGYEWERGLVRATRVGDVTLDPVAKAAVLNPVPSGG